MDVRWRIVVFLISMIAVAALMLWLVPPLGLFWTIVLGAAYALLVGFLAVVWVGKDD